jgi:hypothetical protein
MIGMIDGEKYVLGAVSSGANGRHYFNERVEAYSHPF